MLLAFRPPLSLTHVPGRRFGHTYNDKDDAQHCGQYKGADEGHDDRCEENGRSDDADALEHVGKLLLEAAAEVSRDLS